jgi:hypothetical protein
MEEGDIEAENSRHLTSPRERRNHAPNTTHHPHIGLNLSTIFDELLMSIFDEHHYWLLYFNFYQP